MRKLPDDLHIFGSGSFSAHVVDLLTLAGIHVHEVFDDLPARVGKSVGAHPRPVRHVSTLGSFGEFPVVLGVSNLAADLKRIAETLRTVGANEVLTPVELYLALGQEGISISDHYWMSCHSPSTIADRSGEHGLIEKIPDILADETSKDLFRRQLIWRTSGQLSDYVNPDPLEWLYDDRALRIPRSAVRFVDLGAFTGDTVANLKGRGFDFEYVWAFEPDASNYARLVSTLCELGVPSCALPLAAGNELQMLSFTADGSAAATMSSVGGDAVMVARVADIVINSQPNYVKLDIEGYELKALEGLEPLLRRSRPTLAVSAYHRPCDLWTLPLFVDGLDLDYSLHFRQYGHQGYDTVLYAIPR